MSIKGLLCLNSGMWAHESHFSNTLETISKSTRLLLPLDSQGQSLVIIGNGVLEIEMQCKISNKWVRLSKMVRSFCRYMLQGKTKDGDYDTAGYNAGLALRLQLQAVERVQAST